MARHSRYNTTEISNTTTVFKVGIYVRLSKGDENEDKFESESITSQKEIISNFIELQEDMILVDTYSDDGYSGTSFNRPDFLRMWEDIEKKRINCVIVKDLSRFGRDYIDTGKYLERIFPEMNVRFIALSENIDSFKREYDMSTAFQNIFNANYAKDIQRKVNANLAIKRKSGKFLGAFASYGYAKDIQDKNKLIIDEYPAEIVKRIFNEFNSGIPQLTIAKRLNADGILCPSAYKTHKGLKYFNGHILDNTDYWTYSTIHRILQNEMYTGTMVQGKTYRKIIKGKATMKPKENWVRVENTHPSIIDKQTWNTTQKLLTLDTRQNKNVVTGLQQNNHIFAGLITCGDCGRAMAKNVSSGTFYYVCGSNKRYGHCSRHCIKYKVIYDIILKDFNECIKTVQDLQILIENNKPVMSTNLDSTKMAIKKAESELVKIQKLKQSIYEDYKGDLLTKEEYICYKNDYTKREEDLNIEIATLSSKIEQSPQELFEHSKWIAELLQYKQVKELDRDIIIKMVDHIKIYENNEIEITYNFSDELNEILNSQFSFQ